MKGCSRGAGQAGTTTMTIVRCGVLAAVLISASARADNPGEDARAAYDAGSSEYDLGHYKSALSDFEKAFKLRHIPALLFNIAQCHRMLGEMKEAATVYRSFISKDPQNVRVGQASALLAQVESAMDKQDEAQRAKPTEVAGPTQPNFRQPALAPVATAARPSSAAQPVGTAQAEEIPLVAAAHSSRAVVPTGQAAVARSASRSAPFASPAGPPAPPAQRRRVFTWIALGGAVVATGAGAAFGLHSKSTQSSLSGSLHSGGDVQNLQSGQVSDARRANALFLAGGLLAAASAAFFVLEF